MHAIGAADFFLCLSANNCTLILRQIKKRLVFMDCGVLGVSAMGKKNSGGETFSL